MRIGVLVKLSLDPNMIEADGAGNVLVERMPLAISTYDKNALEEAIRIKEKFGGQVIVMSALTWGPLEKRREEADRIIREALAMGADEAYLLIDEPLLTGDPAITATALATLAKSLGGFDLYLAGEASMDMLSSQLPSKLAEALGITALTFVKGLEVEGNKVVAVRSLEEVTQKVEAETPVVVSVTGEINQPRYTTMLQIRKAFRKPVNIKSLADIGVQLPARSFMRKSITLLPIERKRERIEGENVEELAERLVEVLVKEGILK
jgi:electron transfer flavoprotein beta subunit